MTLNDKILQNLLNSLTIEEMESLIKKKKAVNSPKKMTEREYYMNLYTEKLKTQLYAPKS